ncbi:N-acetylmuramic acid 6-phosphate etherase [Penicillium maclennaniae]|uniref:N-acetylmuramic acid 6-phosphate etherase n=1 Tax=Penicillium maclennaniae TaxID=1343394 RepID=UPI00253FF617|nr:N-acetylmuramic acid 6-phosphate etherase [Penicillium maclennaniae]KAJ5669925.1 N-acetylmuramic acid 6-phosphate etherase [Penicillium maclennaniae]
MLSTGLMIRTGKTYGNIVRLSAKVDLVASNLKLEQRTRNTLRRLSTKCGSMTVSKLDPLLSTSNRSVEFASLVAETGESVKTCEELLKSAGCVLATALDDISRPSTQQVHIEISGRLMLCIDGGGTKCAAVVTNPDGLASHGYGGLYNLNDRGDLQGMLAPKLAEIFGLGHTTANFRLNTDVDLLLAVAKKGSSAVVLIAGTGSVAMQYTRNEDQHLRVARCGGWSHVLGDEGSGYTIGLDTIKHTLVALEEKIFGLREDLDDFEHANIK